ncbi:hypothetical protein ACFV19_31175 [Streptomyces griseoluteus]|uniref:hypothetical protein n=1 Tax=Streptomyces griseoluteus TaxID=29306 RepID=UPI0036B07AF7
MLSSLPSNALFLSAVDKKNSEELDKSYDSTTVGDGKSKTGGAKESEVMKDFQATEALSSCAGG